MAEHTNEQTNQRQRGMRHDNVPGVSLEGIDVPKQSALTLRQQVAAGKRASVRFATSSSALRTALVERLAQELSALSAEILLANEEDLARARAAGLSPALVDRLTLSPSRLSALADAVTQIAHESDPVGHVRGRLRRPSGIEVERVRIPLGLIAVVYESRPNVTIDVAALCLKSGNGVVLRGGREALSTNLALVQVIHRALGAFELPLELVVFVPPGDRSEITELVGMRGLIDLAIPRGGPELVKTMVEHAKVPIVEHAAGVCHIYIHSDADLDQAMRIVDNAKMQRPGVCNALECLLVHEAVCQEVGGRLGALVDRGLEVRADERIRPFIAGAKEAVAEDWGREFLAPILAVKVVPHVEAALEHIEQFGSHHTEGICTRDPALAERFLREVDASCVVANASSRFNDGGELGLGAELGVSTSRVHAYGPMGLESLTTEKWVIRGHGEVRG